MTTIHDERPLALHVKARREWFGESGISQPELARLTGVSMATIRRLETARQLPASIDGLLALSIAFGCQIESLIDPREMERIRRRITGDDQRPSESDHGPIGFASREDD